MDTDKLFNQVCDKFPAVSSLKLWKFKEGFKLIAWKSKHIYINSFTEDQLASVIRIKKLSACYEEILSPEDVVDVFCFGDKFFTVDRQCWISEIKREILQDVEWEGDLFEDTPKKIVKSELKRKYKVCNDSSVLLAACSVPQGISFLINTENSVIVKIINIDLLTEINSVIVRNTSLTVKPHHNKCSMLYVPNENIECSYLENWFPEVKLKSFQSGLLIVSLADSIICGLFLDELPLFPHFMFSWPFQTVASHWFCFKDKEPDRMQRKSNLILVFDGGTVVTLAQYGGKTCYLPLNRIRSAYISDEYILASDYSNCYSLNTTSCEEISCLPLKGLLGFCSIPDQQHIILASSRHKTLYAINMKVKVKRGTFKMPNVEIFDEFLKRNKYLDQLSKQIEQTDDYINALSYALNSHLMNFSFFIQLVLVAGFVHSFRIKVTNRNPGIVFQKNIWNFAISLYSNDNCYTFVRDLENDLKHEDYFVDYISVECKGNNWDFFVNASLVCYHGNTKYRPIVTVGKSLIDISHFIQPISCLKLHESHTAHDLTVEDILENINVRRDSSENLKRLNKTRTCSFEIAVSEELSSEAIVNALLKNCKALWRSTELTECYKKDKFKVFIGGNLFNIEIRKGFVQISGTNGECCHSLKVAAVRLLNINYKLNTSADLQAKLDDLLKSLELLEYNRSDSAETRFNKTLTLYQELKESITNRMTAIKMNFSSE